MTPKAEAAPKPNPWLAERIALLQHLLALTKVNR